MHPRHVRAACFAAVIPVTGRVSGADRAAFAAAAGANGFVEKPVTARALKQALDSVFLGSMADVA